MKELPYKNDNWNILYPEILPTDEKILEKKLPRTINVGIFGHVDTGKSTLLGHLFYKMKVVGEKELRKN